MKVQTVTAATYYAAKDPRAHRYPNAANRRFYAEKIVDGLLAAAITVAMSWIYSRTSSPGRSVRPRSASAVCIFSQPEAPTAWMWWKG